MSQNIGEVFTPAVILRNAAQYLVEHGWVQGQLYGESDSPRPAACLIGAVAMVCYGEPIEDPSQQVDHPRWVDYDSACAHLDRFLVATNVESAVGAWCDDESRAIAFNDEPDRLLIEVVHVLNDAADWDRPDGGAA